MMIDILIYHEKKSDACHEQFYILCKILFNCDNAENNDDRADEFDVADKDYNEYDANDADNSYCHGDNCYDHDDDNDDDNLRMAFQDCVH